MKYDYLIVGAGLFGSVFARQMTDAGARCIIIEKRKNIGGNCYTSKIENIHIHEYGPHIFHTNSRKVWEYINKYTEFNSFVYRPKVSFKDELYSFPINLFTLYQLFGVRNPKDAAKKLEAVRIKNENPQNLEEYILAQVGEEIYRKFIYGYTYKQWAKDPKDLPISIIKRLPIRLNMDDNYFNDRYQGIPVNGYTNIFEKLLKNIDVEVSVDYLADQENLDKMANKIIYTGAIDEFFKYKYGSLEYRSLSFQTEIHENLSDYQGNSVINYTELDVPYTRIVEHKHFDIDSFSKSNCTVVTKETPQLWSVGKERFYPINDKKNMSIMHKYKAEIDDKKYIFGGRMGDYMYYDMHQVIASALVRSEKEIYDAQQK